MTHSNKNQIILNIQAASGILLSSLAFILPLLYFASLRDASSLPRYALYGVLSGILLTLVLSKKLVEHKPLLLQPRLFLAVFLLLAWAWISLSWSIDPKNSLLELIQLTGCVITGFAIAQIKNIKILTSIVICSVMGASTAAAIGIAQYFNFNPVGYIQFSVPSSTFTNPNIATTYLDLLTPVAFSLILFANKNSHKFLAIMSSILCLTFLLISHSRGSWLALVFVIIGFVLLIFRNTNFKKIIVPKIKQNYLQLFIAVLIPLFIFVMPTNVGDRASHLKNSQITFDRSSKIRLDAYINSLSMIKVQPITGTGYGGFRTGFRNYMFSVVPLPKATEDNTLARLHSDPLQIFVELGLFGGLLFIYIYIVLLQLCWRILQTSTNPQILLLISGLFLAILANGVHACVDFPFHKPSSALQFWIWLGIISAISIKTLPVKTFHLNKYGSLLLIAFSLIFSIYNYNYYKNYIAASQYRRLTLNNIYAGNCKLAQKNADHMMDLFDADFRHQYLYVSIYSQCDIDVREKLFAMNRILNYDKTNTRAYITRGIIYINQNSPRLAFNDFLEVTRILPNRASGFIGLAYISLQEKNVPGSINLLEHAIQLEPQNQTALNLLNEINAQLGK